MKKHYLFFTFLSLFVIVAISSCELYNPTEPIPSYIHIQKIDLSISDTTITPGSGQGSKSSKISDAWVYIDDQLIGCFELPATFPVLYEGVHTLKVRAGIKVDGIATNRAPFPFFNSIVQSIDLQKGKVSNLSLTTTYTSSTVFRFMSDFEGTGTSIDTTALRSDTTFQVYYSATPDPNVFEGNKSGIAYLDATHTRFECETVNPLTSLPKFGAPIFLEFNYKCNYQFTVSLYAYGSGGMSQFPVLHFNPSQNWNKAYLYMTPSISGAYSADYYKIAWGMINSTGEDSIALCLDNIKLISN